MHKSLRSNSFQLMIARHTSKSRKTTTNIGYQHEYIKESKWYTQICLQKVIIGRIYKIYLRKSTEQSFLPQSHSKTNLHPKCTNSHAIYIRDTHNCSRITKHIIWLHTIMYKTQLPPHHNQTQLSFNFKCLLPRQTIWKSSRAPWQT